QRGGQRADDCSGQQRTKRRRQIGQCDADEHAGGQRPARLPPEQSEQAEGRHSPRLAAPDWTFPRNRAAVAASAGKNDSMASSDNVTSSGVPNTVVVLKNDSTPSPVASRSGTIT